MAQQFFFTIIYGAIVIGIIYLFVRMFYSIEYVAGETIYNSPIAQKLFPTIANKLFPSWGYDKMGFVKQEPTKYGQNGFWPESGAGYKPSPFGSGGQSPDGGMRTAGIGAKITEVGPVNGDITYPDRKIVNIYDNNASIPEKKVWEVGWWNDSL